MTTTAKDKTVTDCAAPSDLHRLGVDVIVAIDTNPMPLELRHQRIWSFITEPRTQEFIKACCTWYANRHFVDRMDLESEIRLELFKTLDAKRTEAEFTATLEEFLPDIKRVVHRCSKRAQRRRRRDRSGSPTDWRSMAYIPAAQQDIAITNELYEEIAHFLTSGCLSPKQKLVFETYMRHFDDFKPRNKYNALADLVSKDGTKPISALAVRSTLRESFTKFHDYLHRHLNWFADDREREDRPREKCMRNMPTLFSKGHPLKAEARLGDVLDGHKASIIKKIKDISKLEQLTAEFLDKLVADAIVDPVTIHFDKQAGTLETAKVNVNEWVPINSMAGRMVSHGEDVTDLCGGNMKQMARVSIPFSGSSVLLKYAPSTCGLTHPFGEIVDNTIQFGFVMLDASDSERNRVKGQIRGNLEQLKNYADQNNQQVKQFNESLPDAVTGAFKQKLEELQKQYSIFGDLGIPLAANKPEPTDAAEPEARPRGKTRPRQPITYIKNVFVESLTQINYNAGDVNNAIQSN